MTPIHSHRRAFTTIALLAILLRVLVPAGYMPASIAGGSYIKLCSHGMSDSTAMALLGHGEHHHHSGQHDPGHPTEHGLHQCELGSVFGFAVVLESIGFLLALLALLYVFSGYLESALCWVRFRLYDSRAPPNLLIS